MRFGILDINELMKAKSKSASSNHAVVSAHLMLFDGIHLGNQMRH